MGWDLIISTLPIWGSAHLRHRSHLWHQGRGHRRPGSLQGCNLTVTIIPFTKRRWRIETSLEPELVEHRPQGSKVHSPWKKHDFCRYLQLHHSSCHPVSPTITSTSRFLWLSRQLELGWTSNHSKQPVLVSGEVHFFHCFEYGYLWIPMESYGYLWIPTSILTS